MASLSAPSGLIERGFAAWVGAVTRRPRLVLALLALLGIAAVAGAIRVSVDTDSSRMLAPDLPFQERAQAVNHAFPQIKGTIALVLRSDSADDADAAARRLAERLARETDAIAEVFAPSVDPFLVGHGLMFLPLDEFEARLADLARAATLIANLRSDQTAAGFFAALGEAVTLGAEGGIDPAQLAPLLDETAAVLEAESEGRTRPFGWTGVLGGGGEVTRVLTLTPHLDFMALNPAKAAVQAVRRAVADLDPVLADRVEIGITGDPVLRAEELSSVTGTLGLSFGLSLVLLLVPLWLALRRWRLVGMALGALLYSLLLTTGLAGVAAGPLNLVSIAFFVLMTGLGIEYAIHLLLLIGEAEQRGTLGRPAVVDGGRNGGAPLLLSAVSTAAAFLAFAGTDFRGLAQLGALGAAGIVIAFAVTMTMLPALYAVVPVRPASARAAAGGAGIRGNGRAIAAGLAAAALAIGLASIWIGKDVRFDADPMNLRDPTSPSVVTYRWLAADPDLDPLRLSVVTSDAAEAGRVAEALAAVPEVGKVVWIGALVPKDQDAKLEALDLAYPSLEHAVSGPAVRLGDGPPTGPGGLADLLAGQGTPAALRASAALAAYAERADPARDARLAEALFLHFGALIDRIAAQAEAGPVAASDLPSALAGRFVAPDGRHRVEIGAAVPPEDPDVLARFVAAVHAVAPSAGGPPDQVLGAERSVGAAILQALVVAVGSCAILTAIALQSATALAAILIPLALATAVTLAFSVLAGIPFNYANVLVLPLMLGSNLDAGVHIALRIRNGAREVFETSTPRAIGFSALTTVAAFGTLALSDHQGTASMGMMLIVSLLASVLMVFALTPPLMRLGIAPVPAGLRV